MYRFIAFLISLLAGLFSGYYVYINLNEILDKWLYTIGFSVSVSIIVTLILYFPLLRHIGDMVEERFSTIGVSMTSRKTGVNLNEIPKASRARRHTTTSNKILCGMCGGPGGPICENCREKMTR
ncbi:MAG: hypothetical protein JXR91_04870 [Deltaproteobacteria bacterium]|nr:hypothetical protein [Deltaproteobacteria bacterium]